MKGRNAHRWESCIVFLRFVSFPFSIDIAVTFHIIGARARGYNSDAMRHYSLWLVFIRHLCHKYELVANKDEFSQKCPIFRNRPKPRMLHSMVIRCVRTMYCVQLLLRMINRINNKLTKWMRVNEGGSQKHTHCTRLACVQNLQTQ